MSPRVAAIKRPKRVARRAPSVQLPCPTESEEQAALVRWLVFRNILFCHPANGGLRSIITARKLKAQGVVPGVPDILIFQPPRGGSDSPPRVGVAIEMKRKRLGRTTKEQDFWLKELAKHGWVTAVCKGADEAIQLLTFLGY